MAEGEKAPPEFFWTPWIVGTFVAANTSVFLVVMYFNDCSNSPSSNGGCLAEGFLHRFSFQALRENPLLGPSSATLEKLGALEWRRVVGEREGWRLAAAPWLHAGLVHVAVSSLSILFIGIRLEQQFGFIRVGGIYLLSGFGGSLLSSLFPKRGVSVAASAPLFGLIGSMLAELLINWTIYTNKAAALFSLSVVFIVNLAVGIFPFVDGFALAGGFMAGCLLGFVLLLRPQYGWMEDRGSEGRSGGKSKYSVYQRMMFLAASILLISGFAVGLATLIRGANANKHCSWCSYLTCFPTSNWRCDY